MLYALVFALISEDIAWVYACMCVCVCVCVYTRTYPQRIDGHGDQAHPNRRNRGWRVPINRRAALYYVGAQVCVCVCARARVRKRVKHSSCSRQHRYARHFIFILY